MAEYIEREAALSHPFANGYYDHEHANEDFIRGHEDYKEWLEQLPAADVSLNVEISDAVDEAIRILNAIRTGGDMDYSDYCELHDVISAIYPNCGADMREVQDGDD